MLMSLLVMPAAFEDRLAQKASFVDALRALLLWLDHQVHQDHQNRQNYQDHQGHV